MKNNIIILLISLLSSQLSCAQMPNISVSVRVQDKMGEPIEGAKVRVSFRGVQGGSVEHGYSDESGLVALKGRSNLEVLVTVAKDGYYQGEIKSMVHRRIEGTKEYETFDPEFEMILREIRNPIAMKAIENHSINIPRANESFGYDLIVLDWVSPYGEGRISDILIEVDGYFKTFNDKDSALQITFPKEGDGVVKFDREIYSELQSPYIAPEDGYMSEFSLHKMRKYGSRNYEIQQIDETEEATDVVYVFRIRTEKDKNGKVKKAYYGKIYSKIHFYGAVDGALIKFDGIYTNSILNDRNLEYGIGQNLIKGLNYEQIPRRP